MERCRRRNLVSNPKSSFPPHPHCDMEIVTEAVEDCELVLVDAR